MERDEIYGIDLRFSEEESVERGGDRLLHCSVFKMAFATRVQNLLKKAVASNPSVYQAVRCMSSSKLFIGGLSYGTDDQSLKEAFTHYGEVVEARVIIDESLEGQGDLVLLLSHPVKRPQLPLPAWMGRIFMAGW
uniref:RRM domain-containing protein n=1 Tax=Ananas comosus var. bracteatus TaxID=296719 RepID=A0A6V7Q4K9_ANACO|nr:unnamed protein product [Ananas comosus var. bracteatus]